MSRTTVYAGEQYTEIATIYGNDDIYFRAGRKIIVEQWALYMGQYTFDFEVNSRSVNTEGNPSAILTSQDALEFEFYELKGAGRLPIPVTIGKNSDDEWDIKLQQNALKPQIFETKVEGDMICWRVFCKRMAYQGAAVSKGRAGSAGIRGVQRLRGSPGIYAGAEKDGVAGWASAASKAVPNDHMQLVVYVQTSSLGFFRRYPKGFEVTDVIGTDKSVWQSFKDLFQ